MPIPATKDISQQKDFPWLSLLLGVGLFLICYLFGVALRDILSTFAPTSITGNLLDIRSGRNFYRLLQGLSTITTFGLTAFFWSFYSNPNPLQRSIETKKFVSTLFLTLLILVLIQPLIQGLIFQPDGLPISSEWQESLTLKDKQLNSRILQLLNDQDLWGIAGNLIVFCLLPAVFEELLFRKYLTGTLMRVMHPQLAVWLGAIVFSAMHFSITGFLARMILGAILGYFMLWTGNTKISIVGHFLHNLINMTVGILVLRDVLPRSILHPNHYNISAVVFSLVCSIVLLYIFARLWKNHFLDQKHE